MKTSTFAAALLLFAAGHASAFEDMAARPDGFHGSLGLGLGVKPEYPGSKDRETRVMPQISLFYGDTLFLTGMTAGANLLKHQTAQGLSITAGPLLALHRARKEGDNAALSGLGEIDRGLDAGIFLRLRSGPWQLRADVRGDVSDDKTGTTVNLSAGRGWRLAEKLHLRTTVDVAWGSSEHMNTYYGIDAVQSANSGLRQYQADAGTKSVGLNLMGDYRIDQQWAAYASMRYSRLVGDAADSPLVADLGSPNQVSASVGIKYRF